MKIYYPRKKHIYTIIMLHSMYFDNTSFDTLVQLIITKNNSIKIILPNAPLRNIDWPDGKEYNIRAWYNYFTQKNGELEHDKIDMSHYNDECNKIKQLVEQESKYIDHKNIIILGESQGGTIVSKLALEIQEQIGGFILIDTVFMDNILIPNVKYPNIYIYSSECDEVYTLELQKNSIKNLNIENCIVEWHIEKGLNHYISSPSKDAFILKTMCKILNLY